MFNLPRYDVFKRKMLADPGEISRGLSENFGEHQQSDVVFLISFPIQWQFGWYTRYPDSLRWLVDITVQLSYSL